MHAYMLRYLLALRYDSSAAYMSRTPSPWPPIWLPAAPCRRFYLEVVGRQRVRVSHVSELDGYRVAKVEALRDDPPVAGREQELAQVSEQVAAKTQEVIDKLRWASGHWAGCCCAGGPLGTGQAAGCCCARQQCAMDGCPASDAQCPHDQYSARMTSTVPA